MYIERGRWGTVRAVRGIGLALLLAAVFGCATQPLHRRTWLEVDTPHFEILSALGAEKTAQLARDLESFHSALEFVMAASGDPDFARTRVYAYDGRSIIRPFDVRGASGFFLPSLRGGVIVLRTGGGWREDATLKLRHEFAHWLFRQREGLGRPLWFDEGFALLASTVAVREGRVDFGRPRTDHIRILRDTLWIPTPQLVRIPSLEDGSPSLPR